MYGLYPCWDIKGCCNLDYERLCLLAILWILWNVRCLFDKIRLQPYRDYTHRHCSHSPIWCTYKLRGSSNIGFQDSLDCCMDSSSRCIKQVCKFPSGHPYFAIRNMDALSVVEYDSSFHSSIYLSDILLAVSRFLELTKSAYIWVVDTFLCVSIFDTV